MSNPRSTVCIDCDKPLTIYNSTERLIRGDVYEVVCHGCASCSRDSRERPAGAVVTTQGNAEERS